MLFYDFEVTKHDWLVVCIEPFKNTTTVIVNDKEKLKDFFHTHYNEIWCGYNNKHYDQYILKGIMLEGDPKEINDGIILEGKEGWQLELPFNQIRMINYDVMPNPPIGLKPLEAFLGSDIRETDVPFDIDRKLTDTEIEQMIYYCTHDVEETIKVFLEKVDDFNSMKDIVSTFQDVIPVDCIGDSEARITAKVLGCHRNKFDDEFDFYFLPCIQLKKYAFVMDWFREKQKEIKAILMEGERTPVDEEALKKKFYKTQNLTTTVAGIPHTFGFGGLHGAPSEPCHYKGGIYHVDVNNYYPSILLAHNLVTRTATNDNYAKIYQIRKELKQKQQAAKTKEESKKWKKAQLPYKKMLNALSGAMKDSTNPAYDPRNNNIMCINGQLMLLDLIEHLETIEGFRAINVNTDGLIIQTPDTDEAFHQMDDICYDWEKRCSTDKCSIGLALDCIKEIYQKDVNNYLWIDMKGGIERCGDYVKETSRIDNDLPIIRTALVECMAHGVPIEKTINDCKDLWPFQKVVKLSGKYKWVEHECGDPEEVRTGKRVIKTKYIYHHTDYYTNKCYRVFASTSLRDGRLLKCGGSRGKPEKFGNTPDHCFIWNQSTEGVKAPAHLDRKWYIEKARDRLKAFGIGGDTND